MENKDHFATKHSAIPPQPRNGYTFYQEFSIAGLNYYIQPSEALWKELHEGTEMALVRNHNNSYDKNAVAVAMAKYYDGNPSNFDFKNILGYIPASENSEIAKWLDAGFANRFMAEVTEVKRYGNFTERINVTIWLKNNTEEQRSAPAMRVHVLTPDECQNMMESLEKNGEASFAWPVTTGSRVRGICIGDDVAMISMHNNRAAMWLMRVTSDPYVDETSSEIRDLHGSNYAEAAFNFNLTNIVGPLFCSADDISFLDPDNLDAHIVTYKLSNEEESTLRKFFRDYMLRWKTGVPSLTSQLTLPQAMKWIDTRHYNFYYRDTPAPIDLAHYKPGTVLHSDFRIDLSEKFYRPQFPTRFLVCSAYAQTQFDYYQHKESEPGATNWQLCTIDSDASFMVVDVYTVEQDGTDYTQILLVQIPTQLSESLRPQLFHTLAGKSTRGAYPYIESLKESARKDFNNKLKAPVWERQKDWQLIQRMIRPIGTK